MNASTITCTWTEGMAFKAQSDHHSIVMDADAQFGGQDLGARPKPLLLISLAGCTGMDVVALLKKMRVTYESFDMDVTGYLTDEHPKIYHTIDLHYKFKGQDLPLDKIEKAVNLSQERYCGVSAMLRKAADLKIKISINE